MPQGIKTLRELIAKGGHIHAECRQCGRVAKFSVSDLSAYFGVRGWSDSWPEFAGRLRCQPETGGCGNRGPRVNWYVEAPPPPDPSPPRPRFVRNAIPVPTGVDQTEWEKARGERERRRLVRRARD
jgi:hypothetical protein